ncbi:MAG: AlpA family phage regulatory protein [Balneolales bacterium]
MTNLESYFTSIIQKAVKEAIREEISELKEVIRSKPSNLSVKEEVSKRKIIRPAELAEMLSVSITTLWRMEKEGRLPKRFKISNKAVGWLESVLDEWLETKKL